MFHDRRQRYGERRRQRADGKIRLLGEPRQQGPTRRVGKRGKGAIERGGTKLNHVVKYKAAAIAVKQLQLALPTAALASPFCGVNAVKVRIS